MPHVSRGSSLESLDRHLKTHAVVAVVGYPKSGKTTALSEYAQKGDSSVWLTGAPAANRWTEDCS